LLGIKRGFLFIRLALAEAFKNRKLLKPVWAFLLGALIITLILLVPLNLILYFLGRDTLALALIGSICTILLYALFIWGDINTLMAAAIFDDIQCGAEPDLITAREAKKSGWREVIKYDLAYPALLPALWFPPKPQMVVVDDLDTTVERGAWLKGLFLTKPLFSLERLKLKEVPNRIREMVAKNLLRFNPALIRVKRITWWISLLFIALGFVVGIMIGLALVKNGLVPTYKFLIAASVGLLAGVLVALPGIALTVYSRMIYHTAIYRWMVSVEQTNTTQGPALIPGILSRVLNKQD
jgi:hypothetical protein